MLTIEDHDAVRVLRLEHPPANALTNALIRALGDALVDVRDRDETHAVILTGGGTRFFSAGGDIKELEELTREAAAARVSDFHAVLETLEAMPKPVVAAVNGHAAGGGFELCLFADFVLSVPGARFGFPEINHGILPVAKGMQRAVRWLGPRVARQLLFTGELVDVDAAVEMGIVDEVAPPDTVLTRACAVAASLGAKDAVLFDAIKRTLTAAGQDMPEALHERTLSDLGRYFASDGMRAGMRAFRERA